MVFPSSEEPGLVPWMEEQERNKTTAARWLSESSLGFSRYYLFFSIVQTCRHHWLDGPSCFFEGIPYFGVLILPTHILAPSGAHEYKGKP